GTVATRDKIIEDLKKQMILMKQGSHIIPTEAGMQLYQTLVAAAPILVDPAETARMETMLDDVLTKTKSSREAIIDIAGRAAKIIPVLQKAGQS
ncbi:DNA topoisomerase, partial [Acinetobacter baumannii]